MVWADLQVALHESREVEWDHASVPTAVRVDLRSFSASPLIIATTGTIPFHSRRHRRFLVAIRCLRIMSDEPSKIVPRTPR
jgi:hypothetical protein